MKIALSDTSVLGRDPKRSHRINGNSFQQNALTTINGWQYVAFYTGGKLELEASACHVNLARRQLSPQGYPVSDWRTITFDDYEQTMNDGHNTISIGVCAGDDTIHVAFDHHCDSLKFRISKAGTSDAAWRTSHFHNIQNSLPGVVANGLMKEVTYPRFINIDNDLLLTYRIGQAGAGSDILYKYSSMTHQYQYIGQFLTGVSNSPYINGMDYRLSRLHISWCYRSFVAEQVSADPGAHKQQAGPNGPENNFDLNYAFSDDGGKVWKSSKGHVIADLGRQSERNSIMPDTPDIQVFHIPTNSGILNQESQAVDWNGRIWVLNREKVDGEESWFVYHREAEGVWKKIIVRSRSRPTETGSRASICVDRNNNVYLVLPGNTDMSLEIMQSGQDVNGGTTFESAWVGEGFDGEPLVDIQRLENCECVSVFTRRVANIDSGRDVVVLDFLLED